MKNEYIVIMVDENSGVTFPFTCLAKTLDEAKNQAQEENPEDKIAAVWMLSEPTIH